MIVRLFVFINMVLLGIIQQQRAAYIHIPRTSTVASSLLRPSVRSSELSDEALSKRLSNNVVTLFPTHSPPQQWWRLPLRGSARVYPHLMDVRRFWSSWSFGERLLKIDCKYKDYFPLFKTIKEKMFEKHGGERSTQRLFEVWGLRLFWTRCTASVTMNWIQPRISRIFTKTMNYELCTMNWFEPQNISKYLQKPAARLPRQIKFRAVRLKYASVWVCCSNQRPLPPLILEGELCTTAKEEELFSPHLVKFMGHSSTSEATKSSAWAFVLKKLPISMDLVFFSTGLVWR